MAVITLVSSFTALWRIGKHPSLRPKLAWNEAPLATRTQKPGYSLTGLYRQSSLPAHHRGNPHQQLEVPAQQPRLCYDFGDGRGFEKHVEFPAQSNLLAHQEWCTDFPTTKQVIPPDERQKMVRDGMRGEQVCWRVKVMKLWVIWWERQERFWGACAWAWFSQVLCDRSRVGDRERDFSEDWRAVAMAALDASQGLLGIFEGVQRAFAAPASWESTVIATTTIFVIAAPVLFVGLSAPGVLSAFVLGLFTFRAFGGQGTIIVFLYFLIVSDGSSFELSLLLNASEAFRVPGMYWGLGENFALPEEDWAIAGNRCH
jgi:hypothetical protein